MAKSFLTVSFSLFVVHITSGQFEFGQQISKGLVSTRSEFRDVNANGYVDLVNIYGNVMLDVFTENLKLIDDGDSEFYYDKYVFDVDNDGHLDMFSPPHNSQPEHLVFGLGDGHFTDTDTSPNSASDAVCADCDVHVKDVNGDGYLDIVGAISSYGDSYDLTAWYENLDGVGFALREVFDEVWHQSTTGFLNSTWADFNGDSSYDMMVFMNGDASVFLNNGDGTFPSTPEPVEFSSLEIIAGLAGDIDNDGDYDLITYGFDQWSWLENDGNGQFGSPIYLFPASFGYAYDFVHLGTCEDLDNDGYADLLISDFAEDKVVLFKNYGDNTFSESQVLAHFAELSRSPLVDVDADGVKDISIISEQNSVIRNRGNMQFSLPNAGDIDDLLQIEIGDYNLDGELDIHGCAEYMSGIAKVLSGSNGYSLLLPEACAFTYPYYFNEYSTVHSPNGQTFSADFDNDGQNELVYYDRYEAFIAKKDIDGFFTKTSLMFFPEVLESVSGYYQLDVYALDVNSDGLLDIALGDYYTGETGGGVFWLNLDGVNFSEAILNSPTGFHPAQLLDLDNDGDLDFLNLENASVNTGNSSFEFMTLFEITGAIYLGHGDVNNDGLDDIVYEDYIYLNQGDLVFYPVDVPNNFFNAFYEYGSNLQILDVDLNGLNDLVFFGLNADLDRTILVVKQTSYMTFAEAEILFPELVDYAPSLGAYAFHDWNGDLLPDLICYNRLNNSIGEVLVFNNTSDTPYFISGHVFQDTNENDNMDEGEHAMEGIPVSCPELSMTLFTNVNGEFHFPISDFGNYTVTAGEIESWSITTNSTASFDIQESSPSFNFDFGFIPSAANQSLQVSMDGTNPICNHGQSLWLSVLNSGNTAPAIEIQLTLPEGVIYVSSSPEATVNGQTLTWLVEEIANFQPLQISVETNVGMLDFGSALSYDLNVLATDGSGANNYSDTWLKYFLCAFDPNDKTEHSGLGEQNYVDGTSPLEYTIRFQNTGNYVATDVVILDHLNDLLDFETFEPIASSHPMEVSMSDEGEVQFRFANIMLPDSTSDFLGSQGFVRFRVKPIQNLSHGETIFNSANIYFDLNEPVITNETFVTIYKCDDEPSHIESEVTVACLSPSFFASAVDYWTNGYEWQMADQVVSVNSNITLNALGEYWLYLQTENEICGTSLDSVWVNMPLIEQLAINASDTLICPNEFATLSSNVTEGVNWIYNEMVIGNNPIIEVSEAGVYTLHIELPNCNLPNQQVDVVVSDELFPIIQMNAENILTTLTGDYTYEWTLNGQILNGEGDSDLNIVSTGEYGVTITNSDGCSYSSSAFFNYVGIENQERIEFKISPNPAKNFVRFTALDQVGKGKIFMYSVDGSLVKSIQLSSNTLMLDVSDLSSGLYSLVVQSSIGGSSKRLLVIE